MGTPGQRRGPARITIRHPVWRLGAGFLGPGLVGLVLLTSCGNNTGPAPTDPPGAAPSGSAAPLPLPQAQPSTGLVPPQPGLGAEDRALLAEARRIGAQWVVLLVAFEPGRADEAVVGLEELGGVLGTSGPGAELRRVTMPTGNVERAEALPAVTAVDVEQVVPPNRSRPHG